MDTNESLEGKADKKYKSSRHQELLDAIVNADIEKGRQLIFGTDVSLSDVEPKLLTRFLWHAVQSYDSNLVKELLKAKPDLSTPEGYNDSPLWVAIKHRDLPIMRLLVSAGADLREKLLSDPRQPSVLHAVIMWWQMYTNTEITVFMIEHGADVNARDAKGNSVLHVAMQYDADCALVLELLNRGADIEAINNDGHDLLLTATCNVYAEAILPILVSYNVDEETRSRKAMIALQYLVITNEVQKLGAMRKLLQMNVNVNEIDEAGMSLLHWAASSGGTNVVEILLDYGAEINIRSIIGSTPLFESAKLQDSSITKILIDRGADLQIYDDDKRHPIHVACKAASFQNIHLLLQFDADLNAEDGRGLTPFQYLVLTPTTLPCVMLILKHLALLQTKGLQIHKNNVKVIKNSAIINNFYEDCLNELQKMKDTKIYETISFFCFFSKDIVELSKLLRNRDIVNNFKSQHESLFSLYLVEMKYVFIIAENTKDIYVHNEDSLNEIFQGILPRLVIAKIASYLSYEESEILQQQFYFSPHDEIYDTRPGKYWLVRSTCKWTSEVNIQAIRCNLLFLPNEVEISILPTEPGMKVYSIRSTVAARASNRWQSNSRICFGFYESPSNLAARCRRINCSNSDLTSTALRVDKFYVIEGSDTRMASMSVRAGADPNERTRDLGDLHALIASTSLTKHQLALSMIRHGADVNARDYKGYTPLYYAVKQQLMHVIFELLQRNAVVEDHVINCAASITEATKFLPLLIESHGNDTETKHRQAGNAIMCLIAQDNSNRVVTIQSLLDCEVPVDLFNSCGWSSLLYAAIFERVDVVKLLLKYGADVNQRSVNGVLPIFVASGLTESTIAKLLIENGASIHDRNAEDRQYPIHAACANESLSNIQLLLSLGADINVVDRSDRTPFSLMSTETLTCAVKYVIKHFALIISKGFMINDLDLEVIYENSHMQEFYEDCLAELENMKRLNIYNDLSFFSIFLASKQQRTLLFENRDLFKSYNRKHKKKLFPIYFSDIHSNVAIKNSLKRKSVLGDKENIPSKISNGILTDDALSKTIYYICILKHPRRLLEEFLLSCSSPMVNSNAHSQDAELSRFKAKKSAPVTRQSKEMMSQHPYQRRVDNDNDHLYPVTGSPDKFDVERDIVMRNIVDPKRTQWKNLQALLMSALKRNDSALVSAITNCRLALSVVDNDPNDTTLWDALYMEQLDVAERLIRAGTDLNRVNRGSGATYLHWLVAKSEDRFSSLTVQLLQSGADVNAVDKMDNSVLHVAVEYGSPRIVNMLLRKRARVDVVNKAGHSVIYVAAKSKYVEEMLTMLIAYSGDVTTRNKRCVDAFCALSDLNANYRHIRMILDMRFPLDTQGRKGCTLLYEAVFDKKIDQVELLLEYGADLTKKLRNGKVPLHAAAQHKDPTILKILIESGASVHDCSDDYNGQFPIHAACKQELLPNVKLLLRLGADINIIDKSGRTPFSFISTENFNEIQACIIKYIAISMIQQRTVNRTDLLKIRANLDMQDYYERCLTELQMMNEADQLITYEHSEDKRKMDSEPQITDPSELRQAFIGNTIKWSQIESIDVGTLLRVAVAKNDSDYACAIIDRVPDIVSREYDGSRLLWEALENDNGLLASALIFAGAELNYKARNTVSLLHGFRHRNPSIVKLMIARGADINITENLGRTFLFTAVQEGLVEIVEMVKRLDLQYTNKVAVLEAAVCSELSDELLPLLIQSADLETQIRRANVALLMFVDRNEDALKNEFLFKFLTVMAYPYNYM
ncbi:serine/threonine-protein phosphatase 6 regulatory ankyrin repeat subunit B-like [Phymastichus coffea]|uniref:serine/threonine-protein phosphatase 6 regulatory ankyrin repeat subunit B-like n=1 Tax=Phymastichus coffea TaxID=108790 RepID=UPI00273C18CD|nr:serine/threonine-protein phosphatase 6 regulatory ankyrin repeat subunit B-like [Phymastichus coffea]